MRELNSQDDLAALYKTFVYNLGQAEKCYDKDEDLTLESKRREEEVVAPQSDDS